MESRYRSGTIVHARGREWIVLPAREPEVLRLRPLTTAQGDEVGLFLPLEGERVRPARFADPEPASTGDATGIMTLFDAARLSLRSGAGPFRSLGHISVIPRPYQFVPLIMALRQSSVRLLIADDVGVGKTIEAAMIARELLDRGLTRRLGVLCPAHLCDQWERALREKFEIEAVLGSAVADSAVGARSASAGHIDLRALSQYRRQHRFREIEIAARPVPSPCTRSRDRGRGACVNASAGRRVGCRASAFRVAPRPRPRSQPPNSVGHRDATQRDRGELSLAAWLARPNFDRGPDQPLDRKALVPYLVQRRRRDVEKWLGAETPFPERKAEEVRYELLRSYQSLFADVLDYCRDSLEDTGGLRAVQQRVRHWSAIAVLRSLLSSPDAAVMVLGNRAGKLAPGGEGADENAADIDDAFRPQVLDLLGDHYLSDYAPSGPLANFGVSDRRFRRKAAGRFGPKRHPIPKALGAGLSEPPRWVDAILRRSLQASIFVYIVHFGSCGGRPWIV